MRPYISVSVLSRCSSAIAATDAPGCSVLATTSRLNAALCGRRVRRAALASESRFMVSTYEIGGHQAGGHEPPIVTAQPLAEQAAFTGRTWTPPGLPSFQFVTTRR